MYKWITFVFFLCLLMFPLGAYAQQVPEEGLGLKEAIAVVLEKSPQSEIAEANLTAAQQGSYSARGEFMPKLKTLFQYTIQDQVPQIEIPPPAPNAPAQTFPAGSDKTLKSQTTLEQPIFTGLALLSQYRMAKLGNREAEVRRTDTRQELILRTYEFYYGVLLAEKNLEVADQTVLQLKSHVEVAQQFYDNGMTPKNDLLKSQVTLAEAEQYRIAAVHALELARVQLFTLMRFEPGGEKPKLREALSWQPYKPSLDNCIRIALERHPRIMLGDLAIDKGKQGVSLARSELLPNVALVGSLLHEEGGFAETDHMMSATLHAEWMVWDWGSNYYKMKQSQSQLLIARAQFVQVVDLVRYQVRAAYLQLREWQESIAVAEATIEQAEENNRITGEQYRENITTSTEVLDAQTLLAQAKVNYYRALGNFNIAFARLHKAMGVLGEAK